MRVQMITDCGMVLVYTSESLYAAIREAQDNGYKIVSAVQLGGVV